MAVRSPLVSSPVEPMTPAMSLYLDLVRFCAALAVFLGHASGEQFSGGYLWHFDELRHDAVTVFFVLSGFVIAHVAETSERNATDFFINRAARIYSVAMPALALAYALDSIGRPLDPDAYAGLGQVAPLLGIATGLTFTNELWGAHIPQGSNAPYWSLGYEVVYYVLFGCALFAPKRWKWAGCAAIAAIAGPSILILFPIWLSGAGLYRFCRGMGPGREGLGWALLAGSIVAAVALFFVESRYAPGFRYRSLTGMPLEFAPQRYAVAVLFLAHLVGFHLVSHRFAGALAAVATPIRWTAGTTFSLYLFHYPLLRFLDAVLPGPHVYWPRGVVLMLIVLACVAVLAQVTERKKRVWRRAIAALVVSDA